jgi:hypothetical protein
MPRNIVAPCEVVDASLPRQVTIHLPETAEKIFLVWRSGDRRGLGVSDSSNQR